MCGMELQNVYTRWSSYSHVFILGGDELPVAEERFMAWTIKCTSRDHVDHVLDHYPWFRSRSSDLFNDNRKERNSVETHRLNWWYWSDNVVQKEQWTKGGTSRADSNVARTIWTSLNTNNKQLILTAVRWRMTGG